MLGCLALFASLISIILDQEYVRMNTIPMSITPKAIQDLLDELEASKQSRLRAWRVLQRLRMVLSETGSVVKIGGPFLIVPVPPPKAFISYSHDSSEHESRMLAYQAGTPDRLG